MAKSFVPFVIVMNDGERYVAREASSFAVGERELMLISPRSGTVRIPFAEIIRVEDRAVMTDEQSKVREDLIYHLNRSPFAPFIIEMTDGQLFEIVRRMQAGIGSTKGRVVSADGKSGRDFHIRDIRCIRDAAVA
jgi:hypothetical protein